MANGNKEGSTLAEGFVSAKILPTSADWLLARPRLFDELDAGSKRPFMWIEGPAGSGKTSLIASYLHIRQMRAVWYQFDPLDSDPAQFFYLLIMAVNRLTGAENPSLHPLSPAYLGDLIAYGRVFFENVFRILGPEVALVFDNFHDLPDDSAIKELLAAVLDTVSGGTHMYFLSRHAPPARFARLEVEQKLSRLEPSVLQFTPEEVYLLTQSKGLKQIAISSIKQLDAQLDGWAAGWVMVLEHAGRTPGEMLTIPARTKDTLFDYFVDELLVRASSEDQALLLRTSAFTDFTAAMAVQMSGRHDATHLLEDFARKNLFINRLDNQQQVFRYHPLFREFLAKKVRESLSPQDYRDYLGAAANVADGAGRFDDAASLFAVVGDHAGLARLVLSNGEAMLRTGRHDSLAKWLALLPQPMIIADPWLAYWEAMAASMANPMAGAKRLLKVIEDFRLRNDPLGLGIAYASYTQVGAINFSNFSGLEAATSRLVEIISSGFQFPSRELELQVTSGIFGILSWQHPWRVELEPWIARLKNLLEHVNDPVLRLQAAQQLMLYHLWCGDVLLAEEIFHIVGSPRGQHESDPLIVAPWTILDAIQAWHVVDRERLDKAVVRGCELAEQYGFKWMLPVLHAQVACYALCEDDTALAAQHLNLMEASTVFGANLGTGHYWMLRGWEALALGHYTLAIDCLNKSAATLAPLRAIYPEATVRLLLAQVLLRAGQHEQADEPYSLAEEVAKKMDSGEMLIALWCMRAEDRFKRGDTEAAVALLRQALQLARERNVINFPYWQHAQMRLLLDQALGRDIETDYATRLITRRHLLPEVSLAHADKWPWQVKVYTLGRFALVHDGKPVRFSGKAQNKPIELLKALIAFGGRAVSEEKLCAALWPDAEGDAAQHALETTLYRLRKLIGTEAIDYSAGCLSLDARHCWVDAWAFERLLHTLEDNLSRSQLAMANIEDLRGRLTRHYRGDFLARGSEHVWALSYREHLRNRWLYVLRRMIRRYGELGQCQQAIALYRQGLEIDEVAEDLYRGLMACYAALERPAEAMQLYHRCEQMLRTMLGTLPSTATQKVYDALKAGDMVQAASGCAYCRQSVKLMTDTPEPLTARPTAKS